MVNKLCYTPCPTIIEYIYTVTMNWKNVSSKFYRFSLLYVEFRCLLNLIEERLPKTSEKLYYSPFFFVLHIL